MALPVDVAIPYAPRTWARSLLHTSEKRFSVFVVHRRGGKTFAALQHLNRDACSNRDHKYAYIAPLRNQAKRIAWEMLKKIARPVPGVRFNESELVVYYPNGSTISLFGGDNPDALRGIGLHGAVLDEYAQMSPIIFSEIITKCVADTAGYVIIIGTPKGKGHFFRLFDAASRSDMWNSAYVDIDRSLKHERGKVIDNLRRALGDDRELVKQGMMAQEEFDQEWYLSWEAALKGAVYAKQIAEARRKGRIGKVAHDPSLPVYTVWDLGIGDAMSIGFFQKPSSREIWLIDYYENTGLGYPHYAGIISKKPYTYGMHYFPFDIKNKEQSTGLTRLATVEKLFGRDKVDVVPKLPEEDGIDLGRAMWSRTFVDDSVDEGGMGGGLFLDLIGSHVYEYDEARGVYRPRTRHDFASHCGAMWRYAAAVEKEMLRAGDRIEERKHPKAEPKDPIEDDYKGDVRPAWLDEDEGTGPSEQDLARM